MDHSLNMDPNYFLLYCD